MTDRARPGVLVDLDGTLVDTNYLHTLAWSRALQDVGEWAPMNAIHHLIGMGGDQLVQELLGHDNPAAANTSGWGLLRSTSSALVTPSMASPAARSSSMASNSSRGDELAMTTARPRSCQAASASTAPGNTRASPMSSR